jgi:hypothetical protein
MICNDLYAMFENMQSVLENHVYVRQYSITNSHAV